jgi:hypothetical protein
VVAAKEIGVEGSADESKDMVMSRDQNEGRSDGMKTDNMSIHGVKELNVWERCQQIKILFRNK